MPSSVRTSKADVTSGAVPAEELQQSFPRLTLPVQPPYPPAEARSVNEIPNEPGWLYEPKWDGFRCLAFRDAKEIVLQSKAGQPLGRYFPELVAALRELPARRFVLDGEIVICSDGHLSFDELLMRIHPAESRIRKLAAETPVTLMCFDVLVDGKGKSLVDLPLANRRPRLGDFFHQLEGDSSFKKLKTLIQLSPATTKREQAEKWMDELATMGM